MDDYKLYIDNQYEQYISSVEYWAREAFENHIKPFCVKCKFDFDNGMGSWFFIDTRNGKVFDHEKWYFCRWKALKKVVDILDIEVQGCNNSFGELMPQFKYNIRRNKLTEKEQKEIWRKLGPTRQNGEKYKVKFK